MESDSSFGYTVAGKDPTTVRTYSTFPSQRDEPSRSVSSEKFIEFLKTIAYIKSVAGESITKLTDLDNLVQFYVTPMECYVERTDALTE